MRLATGAVLLALLLPASASAVMIDSPNPRYQVWANAARVPTAPLAVTVSEDVAQAPCLGELAGCTDGQTIWLDPNTWAPMGPRFTLYHELGHIFATYYGLTNTERFADSYAWCADRPIVRHRTYSVAGLSLWSRTLRSTCGLIRSF